METERYGRRQWQTWAWMHYYRCAASLLVASLTLIVSALLSQCCLGIAQIANELGIALYTTATIHAAHGEDDGRERKHRQGRRQDRRMRRWSVDVRMQGGRERGMRRATM